MNNEEIRAIDANALLEKIKYREGYVDAREIFLIDGEPMLTLNTLRDEIYQDAVKHGLWQDEREEWPSACASLIKDEIEELCEAAEAWEDIGVDLSEPDAAFAEELADVIIMCMSVAGKLGIDIDAAVREKMAYNKTRPWKHEGERE